MPTPALRELQSSFWDALASDPGSNRAAASFLDTLEPSATMDAASRLQVYVDAYYWRIHQVLRDNFARVAAQVSSEQFEDLVTTYLQQHPSRHPSIAYIGVHFAEFLRSANVSPCLVDLARLEWANATVFEAPDAITLSPAILREVAPDDWPGLRFQPIPGLEVLDLQYPVHLLWRDDDAAIDTPQSTRLRLWRAPEFKVMHSVLDEREARALASLMNGDDFATICEAFADLPEEEAAQESIGLLVRWLDDGILASTREPANRESA